VADDGGARLESTRKGGLPVVGGGGPGAGSGGEARALERSQRGVETGGRGGEKVGVPSVGVPRGAGVPAEQSGGEMRLTGGPRHSVGWRCR
jgi:hypothetical protein